MQEQLVGYLLDALDPDERRCVERLLEEEAEARHQLEILRDLLLPLANDTGFVEAPSDLVARTCEHIQRAHESDTRRK